MKNIADVKDVRPNDNLVKHHEGSLLYLFSLILQIVIIPFFSTSVLTDGINPLALGFKLRGDNWTDYLRADGYYYKYGQLLFQLPFIVLIKSNVVLYRVLLFVNAVLVSFIPVCAFQILTKHLRCADRKISWGIALLTGVIPAVTLNSKYTWAEPLLMLLPWLIMLLLFNAMDKESHARNRRLYGLLLGFLQTYAYMVHNRGLVILAASLLSVLFLRFVWKKKCISLPFYFSATIVMCVLDRLIAAGLKQYLYGTGADLVGTGTGIINRDFIRNLFSAAGIKALGEELVGWLFANMSSTLGLSALGIMVSLFVIFHIEKLNRITQKEFLLVLFSFLCFLGALALGSLFFFNDILAVAGREMVKRGEKLIYARYLDGAGICVCFAGLYFLFVQKAEWIKKCILYAGLLFLFSHGFFVCEIAMRINNTVAWSSSLLPISYFCNLAQTVRGGSYTTIGFLAGGIALWGLFGILFFGTLMARFRNKTRIFFSLYIGVFLLCYFWNSYNSIFRQDHYVKKIMDEYRTIISCAESAELKNIYLDDEILRCAFQYTFSDYYVITRRDDNRFAVDQMFILSFNKEYNQELYHGDYYEIVDDKLGENLDYHLYIKGEQLNEQINQNGFSTRELSWDEIR